MPLKTFYIFASGEYGAPPRVGGDGFVIAADGGLAELEKLGRRPDLIVGDLDSWRGPLPDGVEVIRHPVMKDDTDTALAVSESLRRGAERIVVYGGLGGRLDHTVANLQLLAGLARRGVEGILAGKNETVTAVTRGELRFDASFAGTVSVFAWGGTATVSETGLLYGLDRCPLRDDVPRGVSNEFTGQDAVITVHEGTALIMWGTRETGAAPERRAINKEEQRHGHQSGDL